MELSRSTLARETSLKSWGETQLARLFDRRGISYLYEHPVAIIDSGKTRVWYPDFYLPRYGILVEYFGRSDDPVYAAGMKKKQALYEANGLTAVLLTPEVFQGDWPGKILSQIDGILTSRLSDFRNKLGTPARSNMPQGGKR